MLHLPNAVWIQYSAVYAPVDRVKNRRDCNVFMEQRRL